MYLFVYFDHLTPEKDVILIVQKKNNQRNRLLEHRISNEE